MNLKIISVSSLILLNIIFINQAFSQKKTNTLRGKVIDKLTRSPLPGANLLINSSDLEHGVTTDENGLYVFQNLEPGRYTLSCTYIGYDNYITDEIIINASRETVHNIELNENATITGEVTINAYKNIGEPVNEMAVVSGRSFSTEETERYAASVNDPGRMALSFPGVQQGRDDSENDIIIRGNSSIGMLWRLEGIDIPNPNHFARPGTSGGGVTVFSAQLLNRSDFFTGGMPAEYGNSLSGAFDVRFRTGNLSEKQHRFKAGLLGIDFMTEGPIKEGKSSYLINYRYSTLGILTQMGVYIVGERVTNKFQDLSFNLLFQGNSPRDYVTIFGIGGLSEEHYNPVADVNERELGVSRHWEDRIRHHDMGAAGITYTRVLNEKSQLKAVGAIMGSNINFEDDTLGFDDVAYRYNSELYKDWRIGTAISYINKLNPTLKFKTGFHFNQIFYDYFRTTSPRGSVSDVDQALFGVNLNGNDDTQTIQQYAQVSKMIGQKLTLNAGVHVLGFMVTNDWNIDPRLSLRFKTGSNQSLSLAYGIHSQIVPVGTFFYTDPNGNQPNNNLDMIRAHHLIGGYRLMLTEALKLGIETYYQKLINVPVLASLNTSYWMLNQQSGFPSTHLVSEGSGRNYGIDVTLEKLFSNGLFTLLTGSVFESNYKVGDSQEFNTRYSTKYTTSFTFGKEFQVRKSNTLQLGARVLYNGGFRFTPHDPIRSAEEGRYIPMDNSFWSGQINPYFRIDTRISYRMNKKYGSILSLDIQNISNYANPRSMSYNFVTNSMEPNFHSSGLVPVLSYQIDF